MIDAAGTHVIYEVKHLEKSFGKVEVLKDINIQIGNGEVLTIIGPSGSGKSTFLRCLNLLEKPTGGELWFDGRLIDGKTDVKMLRRDVGMVFQSFNLFPMFSAVENVMYAPVHINKLDKKQAKEEAMELLSRVGMADRANHYPGELSGGQQQRVALARAFVIEPGVLLMDEPLSNLDAKLRVQMRTAIKKLQRRLGITTIYVTHDQEEALAISDRIAVMKEGNIMQVGTPEAIYKKPENTFVAGFIGVSNFVECEVKGDTPEAAVLDIKGECKITCQLKKPFSGKGIISARPEQLFFDEKEGLPGKIIMSTFLGDFIEYEIELDNGQTLQLNEYTKDVQTVRPDGQNVKVNFDIHAAGVYDAATQEVISW